MLVAVEGGGVFDRHGRLEDVSSRELVEPQNACRLDGANAPNRQSNEEVI